MVQCVFTGGCCSEVLQAWHMHACVVSSLCLSALYLVLHAFLLNHVPPLQLKLTHPFSLELLADLLQCALHCCLS